MALQWVISKIIVTVKLVKITISGDFEQSMAQRRRMFQSQWRPNIYFSQRFLVPILSQPPLLNRDQSKCIVDLSGNSQLSLKARNSCIDSQWYKKDLLACNLRLDLVDLLIQPVSLGNQKSIHVWRQIRIPHTTWGVYTSTRRSQHKYSLLPRENNKTRNMSISLKLFLEVLIKRKSDSWDVRTF